MESPKNSPGSSQPLHKLAKPQTSQFLLYQEQQLPILKKQNPELKQNELTKLIILNYDKLSETEKSDLNVQIEQNKLECEREMQKQMNIEDKNPPVKKKKVDKQSSVQNIALTKEGNSILKGKDQITVPKPSSGYFSKKSLIRRKTGNISDFYDLKSKKLLGKGGFGSVISMISKQGQVKRAVKIISKKKIVFFKQFLNEIEILKQLDHPNVIKLFEIFEDNLFIYLVMECCEGGELFDQLIKQKGFSEQKALNYFRQIAQAVNYCHNKKVCHRDLKPENLLLLDKKENSPLKVIDFGLSVLYQDQHNSQDCKKFSEKVGSTYYMSPEVLSGQYDELCDIWSLGVILYIMLAGYPPFNGRSDSVIQDKIKTMEFPLDTPELAHISPSAKDLIKKCLTSADKRINSQQVVEHMWLAEPMANSPVIQINIQNLIEFTHSQKLKKIVLTYIASQLNEEEIANLGKLFKQIDTNNDGVLSIQEIISGLAAQNYQYIEQFKKVINNIDLDGSGQIDYTEFLAASIESKVYLQDEKIFMAFKMLDLDGNGKISKDEIKKVLHSDPMLQQLDENFWDDLIKDADTDGDGEIDFNEFYNMMQYHAESTELGNAVRMGESQQELNKIQKSQ